MTWRPTIAEPGWLSIYGLCVLTLVACREPDVVSDSPSEGARRGLLVETPVTELSGMVYHRGAEGNQLLLVGDSHGDLVRLPAGARLDKRSFLRSALPGRARSDASQFEGIASDGGTHVYVLEESPGAIYAYDLSTGTPRLAARYQLVVPDEHPLARAWAKGKNARGEGLVHLGPGRFLVAKQRKPRALIEFGPPGATPFGVLGPEMSRPVDPALSAGRLVPLASWKPDDTAQKLLDDLSDLSWGPGGALYVISSRSRRIARLALPLNPGDKARFGVQRHWDIDARIVGIDPDEFRPEGLAFDGSGRVLIGLDRPAGKRNLLVMPALR